MCFNYKLKLDTDYHLFLDSEENDLLLNNALMGYKHT